MKVGTNISSGPRASLRSVLDSKSQEESKPSAGQSRGLPALGFLVADSNLRPLAANEEAVGILTYPGKDGRPQNLAEGFNQKIGRHLVRSEDLNLGGVAIPVKSGRRTYFCRAFRLHGNGKGKTDATVVMALERGLPASLALSQVSERFRLTPREQETVSLLLQGLANKEMADRMAISVNTVKALLRLVMVKMAASSRADVVAKILVLMMSPHGQEQN